MNTLLVLSALFAAAAAGSLGHLDWRIVGGKTADDGQFPYQISMRVYGSHSCGGTILNERWILTAGHCVYGGEASTMTVVAGSNSLSRGGDEYEVEDYFLHEKFDMGLIKNDVSLLKLKEPISMGDKVQPLGLNVQDIGGGEDLVLSGWGTTTYPGNVPDKLQYINLKSITVSECQAKQRPMGVYDSQICTFTQRGEGACHGDSGGPLVYKGKVAGIVSWGRPCAVGFPDVFTRVSSFADWIQNTIEKNS